MQNSRVIWRIHLLLRDKLSPNSISRYPSRYYHSHYTVSLPTIVFLVLLEKKDITCYSWTLKIVVRPYTLTSQAIRQNMLFSLSCNTSKSKFISTLIFGHPFLIFFSSAFVVLKLLFDQWNSVPKQVCLEYIRYISLAEVILKLSHF